MLTWSSGMMAQVSTPVLRGDVDGDGVLTKKDITRLSFGLAGKPVGYTSNEAADFNGDGVISVKDLVLLIDAVLHPTTGECNGHTWVDLGLSVKWATCNVGANSPEEYGNYYAWGETVPKSSYTWNNYLSAIGGKMTTWSDCGTSRDPLRGYVIPNQISIASTQHDAVNSSWGGYWHMPTQDEMTELCNNCYWQWTNNYKGKSKAGYIVYKAKAEADKGKYSYYTPTLSATYSLSDTHIFLPASGYRSGAGLCGNGNAGHYWSANPTEGSSPDALSLSFDSGLILWLSYFRNNGFSVRAVIE